MITNTPHINNQVPIIDEAALGWLLQSWYGKVLAVVNHATTLLTEEEEMVWFSNPN
jgi:hypothetical protein